ncbi:hypothetical protein SS50377_23821 [Spironucleus salmonicida]|uniref:Uncharacterized protein n=1 Tax=Spironucleus salmonicida TaxID=348837 RepID=V6LPG6_9EUKA|nr:hypothetical protein SS50377_23821 [Spironucleus salmonicida]|eukprot:EST46500.1 Hypothetical protein SS50377_13581 [Spironucleus salmonicida]
MKKTHKFNFSQTTDAGWVKKQFQLNGIDILDTEYAKILINPLKKKPKQVNEFEAKLQQYDELRRKNIVNRANVDDNKCLIHLDPQVQQINIDDLTFMPQKRQKSMKQLPTCAMPIQLPKKRSLKNFTKLQSINFSQ